ncbi:quinone-dependent dihydroorotate dehydrogenase [Salinisphaera sp. USBA-960]|uniref:quinone-dependent dihydroorotate dehydrogenase n=1 Tax=Salinisphaera orenii TaxID=856731 RepID=UPI000DBE6496|nr:quinone-dependent dihydroorotate dehydrogenase [Salifodinibacter halophilus]NNC25864.1 quinone-dependent dihydroorotate dehydrogenase [Salifodinibacter halophilus]
MYALSRAALFKLDPERAHELTLSAIARSPAINHRLFGARVPSAPVEVMGLSLANPVGVAAGLDKDAVAVDGLAGFGFGFVEVGTVTPKPQAGNPRPRVFRLTGERALINRLGFNNNGVGALVERLGQRQTSRPVGVNLGKNRDTPADAAIDDYRAGLAAVYPQADYVTVNISSPNTPGLRDLQAGAQMEALLTAVVAERDRLASLHARRMPLAVKIAPDLDRASIDVIASVVRRAGVDGVIATNTTVSRQGVSLRWQAETGGLSGAPLRTQSNAVIAALARQLGDTLPIIGVGGVQSARDVADKFAAGASAVQLYTGLIYRGPGLVRECAAAAKAAVI